MTLTEFLLARIAEDEAVARAAIENGEGSLDWADDGDPTDTHIARHDPARVLAECEAKRTIVALAFDTAAVIDGEWGCAHSADQIRTGVVPATCAGPEEAAHFLKALASVYSDHADYLPEWKL